MYTTTNASDTTCSTISHTDRLLQQDRVSACIDELSFMGLVSSQLNEDVHLRLNIRSTSTLGGELISTSMRI